VWRDISRHADRDTGRAVDEQVGETRGKNRRLLAATVVVGFEIHRSLINFGKNIVRRSCETTFGVPHRCCAIAIK